jgi:hypothetical protein
MRYSLNSLLLEDEEETPIEPAGTPSTPSGAISRDEAKQLIKETKGKIFTVTFVKKDGSERTMNARLGVTVYLRGGQLAYDAESKGLLPVFDMQIGGEKGYRIINLNTILSLKIGGNTYTVQ